MMELVARTYRSRGWRGLATRAQGSYSAAYAYRYGDRLYQVTSNFPGETNSPVYEYGGDGKLRKRGTVPIKYGLGFNPVNEVSSMYSARGFVYEPHKAVSERLALFGLGLEFWGHDHLIRDENPQNAACNRVKGIKYHVPRTPERIIRCAKRQMKGCLHVMGA